jgi:uncharacterized protein YebE (UPF0316 family)
MEESMYQGDYNFDVPTKLIDDLYNAKIWADYGENGKMPVCLLEQITQREETLEVQQLMLMGT